MGRVLRGEIGKGRKGSGRREGRGKLNVLVTKNVRMHCCT